MRSRTKAMLVLSWKVSTGTFWSSSSRPPTEETAGQVCVTVARGIPCLGPVTQAGCGALCPRYARGCYGCFGPQAGGNPAALARRLPVLGQDRAEVRRAFRFINAWAEGFREQAEES